MRFLVSHESYPAYDWYTLAPTPEAEAEVERLGGPREIAFSGFDWPRNEYPYRGWTDALNSLWWPRDGDQFASLVLLIDDTRKASVAAVVAAQEAAVSTGTAPRPYVVLKCLKAPAEAGFPAEGYEPAGLDPVAEETELVAWKLYPLAPVRLGETTDAGRSLWLLPLVDVRYFWRATPLQPLSDGSSSSSGTAGVSFPLLRVDHHADPDWMPPLRAYPDDAAAPLDYDPIADNGTHPAVEGNWSRGVAADAQARMQNWRVVCRDVRSGYNCPFGFTPHAAFAGVVCDYPDTADLAVIAADIVTVEAGGSGYAVGDLLEAVGGAGRAASVRVTAVDAGGGVTAARVRCPGSYTVEPTNPVDVTAVTGTGSGATLILFFVGVPAFSYHADAQFLTRTAGNRIAGGLTDAQVARDLTAHKLCTLFRLAHDDFYYQIVVRQNVDDPYSTAHLTEDADGPDAAERLHCPKVFLGVEAGSRNPTGAHRAALVAAAKQWAALYYRWRRRQAFWKFPGIAPVIPNGHAAVIRWDFSETRCETTYVAVEGVAGTDDGFATPREPFHARIDGEGAVEDELDGRYAYAELQDSDGELTEKADGRVGRVRNVNGATANSNPAREESGKRAVPVGLVVLMVPGEPYLDADTGEVWDAYRFTTPDLMQLVRLKLTGERNSFGHLGAIVRRWNPDVMGFVDSQEIWVILQT